MKFALRRMSLAFLIAWDIQVPASATENGQIRCSFGVDTVPNGLLSPHGNTQYFNYARYSASTGLPGRMAVARRATPVGRAVGSP
ncbi:hypothetical protein LGN17_18090 [Burkholderia sp. AU30280]|uniref:hypothetical protein n=1 Tax=Burkholderia sp. AU30280 TaxID=2879628 RepID=UPI001CF1E923|nr:hypothetical protein [Burkholderia sp. AU30280]MCA8274403.1 hypothetical protein [Burkholderia sp. AU30280]